MLGKRKFYKIKPTLRQKMAIDNFLSGSFKSIASAMRSAGYSEKSSFNPAYILASRRGVQAYLKQIEIKAEKKFGMPLRDKVMTVFLDGLEANKLIGSKRVEFPDFQMRKVYANELSGFFGWFK